MQEQEKTTFDVEELKAELSMGICEVVFTKKKDGSERVMHCTRKMNMIPEDKLPKGGSTNVDTDKPTMVRVYDVEAEGWRSFDSTTVTKFVKSSEFQYELPFEG